MPETVRGGRGRIHAEPADTHAAPLDADADADADAETPDTHAGPARSLPRPEAGNFWTRGEAESSPL
jgi:hypothetical protein